MRLPHDEDILFFVEKIRGDSLTVQSTEELVDAHLAFSDSSDISEVALLIERVVGSYMETIYSRGIRLKKIVEQGEDVATLTFHLEAI